MAIDSVYIENFRNLKNSTSLSFHPEFNFFVGDNGSGKSSLLETLFFVSHGRSFRTSTLERVIQYSNSEFIISLKMLNDQFGIRYKQGNSKTEIKKNGVRLSSLTEFVKYFAVQLVTPESFKLFFGGPSSRRKFVDLGMFHVEHSFSSQWKEFNRILKQRNACIKNKVNISELKFWNEQFAINSERISEIRQQYINQLILELKKWLKLLLPNYVNDNKLNIFYFKGWSSKIKLIDQLHSIEERERKVGHSLVGAQKFDLKMEYNGIPIEQQLSRGEQKLFLLALTMSQTVLIDKIMPIKPILLIDDVGAELDTKSRSLLYKGLERLNCQVFVTSISKEILLPMMVKQNKYKMFHVEHGEITAITN